MTELAYNSIVGEPETNEFLGLAGLPVNLRISRDSDSKNTIKVLVEENT